MSTEGSVTRWLCEVRDGDDRAAQQLWERYFARLIVVARRKLSSAHRRVADEEDVATTALQNVILGIRDNRLPQIRDRNELWRLLLVIAERRSCDAARRSVTRKTYELGESGLGPQGIANSPHGRTRGMVEPSPEFVAEVNDTLEWLVECQDDDTLKTVAEMTLQGYTAAEIAQRLGCVSRTIERKLAMIRSRWIEMGVT